MLNNNIIDRVFVHLVYSILQTVFLFIWYTLYYRPCFCLFGILYITDRISVYLVYSILLTVFLFIWYTLYYRPCFCLFGILYITDRVSVYLVYSILQIVFHILFLFGSLLHHLCFVRYVESSLKYI